MSLDNLEVIDAIGIQKDSGVVSLSIIDAWGWADQDDHLKALQDKLNAYFHFIETGQIYEAYPDAEGRVLQIEIIGRFPIPDKGLTFIEKASEVAAELDLTVIYRLHRDA